MILQISIIILLIGILSVVINGVEDYCRDQDKKSKMSFKEAMDLVELPVVTFYNGNTKLNFLLDTGANQNVVNSHILDSLKYKKIEGNGSIFGMEGTAVEVDYISMEFVYNNNLYTSTFQVVDMQEAFDRVKQESGVQIHGILGSLFFQEYEYILDFQSLVAYSKK
jgi:predicted aspartyl protease